MAPPSQSALVHLAQTCCKTHYILAIIFIIGYIFIFISVISQQSKIESAGHLKLDLTKEIENKAREITRLRSHISQLQIVNDQPKKDVVQENIIAIDRIKPVVLSAHSARISTRPGVIILGMHRSGTSIVGGLMSKMGLNTGGPLIEAAEDNAKGFFERVDVVLQNDALMKNQNIHYSYRTYAYDSKKGLKDVLNGENEQFFGEGRRGLLFLNNISNYPWMLKDPRLCITLRTWLPLLNFVPAILFTYRHPMDVALSLNTRYEHMRMGKGIKLWYIYNKMAIKQSHDLCRVTASHRDVMKNPRIELDRIYDELIQCGVSVPHKISDTDLNDFIDPKLQHGKSTLKDTTSCDGNVAQLMPPETWKTTELEHIKLYREAMRVYCAFEDGSAFSPSFKWDESIKDDS